MEHPGVPPGVGLKLLQFGLILYLVDQAAVKVRGAAGIRAWRSYVEAVERGHLAKLFLNCSKCRCTLRSRSLPSRVELPP
jgi:hypothetical protein